MHRLLHDDARPGTAANSAMADANSADRHAWVKALFNSHETQADCDGFDDMTQTGYTGFDLPSFGLRSPRQAEMACHAGWHLAQEAAGFLARGPPLALI